MEAGKIITSAQRDHIKQAVAKAEKLTSGEIRVFVEDKCKGDVLDRAALLFHKLKLHHTKERNGVLIYVSVVDHKFAIIGDAGIHKKVQNDFWNKIKEEMARHFLEGNIAGGIVHAVHESGKALSVFFPHRKDDTNELPDDVILGGEA